MPKTKSEGQATVKVPKGMLKTVDEFLKTDKAKKMGLDSKSDVVTEALRALLKEAGLL